MRIACGAAAHGLGQAIVFEPGKLNIGFSLRQLRFDLFDFQGTPAGFEIGEVRLGGCDSGFGARHFRTCGGIVNGEQWIAFFDRLALADLHGRKLAGSRSRNQ